MLLQKKIISEYKELYPKHTLQKISNHTGIQITRVFRIMNGQEMKLSEYQAFQEAIHKKQDNQNGEFLKLIEESLFLLSSESIQEIKIGLMRKLSLKKMMSA